MDVDYWREASARHGRSLLEYVSGKSLRRMKTLLCLQTKPGVVLCMICQQGSVQTSLPISFVSCALGLFV